jgi:hypothetical protein
MLARESLPATVCAALAGLLAMLVSQLLSADGYLALVGGRFIANHGLPHHDTLATLTYGRPWVDQQWLGQLGMYAIANLGGVRLLLSVNVVLVAGAFVGAIILARRRGAQPSTVAVIALLTLLPFLLTAMNVRTQSFVYLPFLAVVALSAASGRLSLLRALLLLGILIVWANVHGSVLVAAVVVSARAATDVWTARRTRTDAGPAAWFLLVMPWVGVFASPYHVSLVSYYRETVFNASFATYLSQWAPTTLSPISAPLLFLVFATVWMLGRVRAFYSGYERLLLGGAILLGVLAVRDWPFSVLLLLALTPAGFDRAIGRRRVRDAPWIGALIAPVAVSAADIGLVTALRQPVANLTSEYPAQAAAAAVRAAGRTDATIYGGVAYSDWLLWTHPEVAGRIAFDVRYELLHADEVKQLVLFDAGSGVDRPLGAARVFVLNPDTQDDAIAGLRPDVRTVYETEHAVVAVTRNRG